MTKHRAPRGSVRRFGKLAQQGCQNSLFLFQWVSCSILNEFFSLLFIPQSVTGVLVHVVSVCSSTVSSVLPSKSYFTGEKPEAQNSYVTSKVLCVWDLITHVPDPKLLSLHHAGPVPAKPPKQASLGRLPAPKQGRRKVVKEANRVSPLSWCWWPEETEPKPAISSGEITPKAHNFQPSGCCFNFVENLFIYF